MINPRILVIGASGFVGRHLVALLSAEYGAQAVIDAGRDGATVPLDLCDGQAIRDALDTHRPTHVVNLAGLAAPADAARAEAAAWALHVYAVTDLGHAILEKCPETWLLNVGSGLAYGRTARHGRPVGEGEALEPLDVYGVTKAAGDLSIGALAGAGLRAVRLRPFNHTGPGQSTDFAVPAFAAQIARIEAGLQPPMLEVGNLDAARDFLHVTDVVEAYVAVIRASHTVAPGLALNVASGEATPIREVLNGLLALTDLSIEVRPDSARQRPSDLEWIAGDASVLSAATGWTPRLNLDRALADVLAHARAQIRTG